MERDLIVFNLEPLDYSKKSIDIWQKNNFRYEAHKKKSLSDYDFFDNVIVLIVRLGYKINHNILSNFKNLKYILSSTTGVTHVDLNLLTSNNISLIYLRDSKSFLKKIPSTAELTWGLILDLTRNITNSVNDVRLGNWSRDKFKGYQLFSKTIGIIGLGRLGNLVAGYAKAFGLKVIYYDPKVRNNEFIRAKSIEELGAKADIITIHIHADSQNLNLINYDKIKYFKKGCFLINTSRAEIWSENCIIKSLDENILSGVATDVLSEEIGGLCDNILWKNKDRYNILITPHIGGASFDAMWICEEFLQNKFLKIYNLER